MNSKPGKLPYASFVTETLSSSRKFKIRKPALSCTGHLEAVLKKVRAPSRLSAANYRRNSASD